jgi:6-pyruvoyl-tetrahydropterin synthase
MVIDFSVIKAIVKEEVITPFDHATVLNTTSPHKALADQMEADGHKIQRVAYQPTCENMIVDFAQRIQKRLPEAVQLYALKLRETGTAYAEWYAADQSPV